MKMDFTLLSGIPYQTTSREDNNTKYHYFRIEIHLFIFMFSLSSIIHIHDCIEVTLFVAVLRPSLNLHRISAPEKCHNNILEDKDAAVFTGEVILITF